MQNDKKMVFKIAPNGATLSQELANLLKTKIDTGELKVGEKLPPSKTMEQQAGVSRSVVREAVAQLKAEGLLESRQGVGVFVCNSQVASGFTIAKTEFENIQNAIQILQLRAAVEVEMSGMAAKNRTDSQLQKINAYLISMDEKIAAGLGAMEDDLGFHKAIADASGNPYFARFIDFIGAKMVPARELITKHSPIDEDRQFLAKIRKEHHTIFAAIEQQNVKRAKSAAMSHLRNSIHRHQKLVEQYQHQTDSIFTRINKP